MTDPHPQPMEITSKQMARVYNAIDLKSVHSVMDEIRDIYTATSPHTPAAPAMEQKLPFPLSESEVCKGCVNAIRKDEREQVLTAIDDCATTDGEWIRFDGTDFLYLNYTVLSKKIESLRGGAP